MNHDIVTPEDHVQEGSVIDPGVVNISTPAPRKKRRKRKGSQENTGGSSLFESNAALIEENQRLQSEVKRAKRAEAEAFTLLDITLRRLKQRKDELAEGKRNHSGER